MKRLNFIQKVTKTGVIKNIDQHPVNSRNYAAGYYQTLEEFPGPLLPEKIEKWKNCKYFEKFLKFVKLKSWRTFHYIYKYCSKTVSNPRESSVALEARET